MERVYVPNVGDVVKLNDLGLQTIFGTTVGLSHMKLVELTVESVEFLGGDVYEVDVDDPELAQYMTSSSCFDLVRRV